MRAIHLIVSAVAALLPLASSAGPLDVDTGCRLDPNTRLSSLNVLAYSTHRQPVSTLSPEQIVLTDGKSRISPCEFIHKQQPVSIGILLDSSASMAYGQKDRRAIAAAGINRLLDLGEAGDEFFLDIIHENAPVVGDFTSDRESIRSRIPQAAKGRTSLIDAIHQGLLAMSKAHNPNRALIVFSDLEENSSVQIGTPQLLQESVALGTPVILIATVGYRDWVRVPPIQSNDDFGDLKARQDIVVAAARRSGGGLVVLPDRAEVSRTIASLAAALHSPYKLTWVTVPSSGTRPPEYRLSVEGMRQKPELWHPARN